MSGDRKVTAGPWKVEHRPENDSFAEINGAATKTLGSAWYALAKVVVHVDDEDSPEGRANLDLILSAVNVCFSLSPQHPERVPPLVPEMVRLLRNLVAAGQLIADGQCNEADDILTEIDEEARALLARLDVHETEGK